MCRFLSIGTRTRFRRSPACSRSIVFSRGETIVKEGSVGDSFFLIDAGEAGVFIRGKGRTTLKPGDYFGEIALIDEGTRMASIIASTELVCHELTSRDFRSLVGE